MKPNSYLYDLIYACRLQANKSWRDFPVSLLIFLTVVSRSFKTITFILLLLMSAKAERLDDRAQPLANYAKLRAAVGS